MQVSCDEATLILQNDVCIRMSFACRSVFAPMTCVFALKVSVFHQLRAFCEARRRNQISGSNCLAT